MPARPARGFSLFPLGIVALPTEHVPLHIFEDRYLRMIDDCLGADRGSLASEFGIVWLSEQGLKDVGCACEIESILDRVHDGPMNILARGTRPFRLLERQDDLPYPAGVVELLDEHAEERDDQLMRAAHELYLELLERASSEPPDADAVSEMHAYAMAATVEFASAAKQELLELRSENARLRLLARLLAEAIDRLELTSRAQARALSNGKVRFS